MPGARGVIRLLQESDYSQGSVAVPPTDQTATVFTEDEDEAGPVGDEDDEDEDEEGSEGEEDEVGLSYLMKEGIQVSPRGRAGTSPRT